MRKVSIYCDGSSTGTSTGACGWGWIVTDWEVILTAGFEGCKVGTNNIAEMNGAIYGLKAWTNLGKPGDSLEIVSDSMYCLGIADGSYQPTKNLDLARELRALVLATGAKTRWVRGHGKDAFNNKVDELARQGRFMYTAEKELKKSVRREEKKQQAALKKKYKKERSG